MQMFSLEDNFHELSTILFQENKSWHGLYCFQLIQQCWNINDVTQKKPQSRSIRTSPDSVN